MNLSSQYGDDSNLRARQRLWDISRTEPELDFHEWSIDLLGDARFVLDAGCGNGRPLSRLRARAVRAVGLDLFPEMVRIAGGDVVGDVQRLPFATGTFDGAVALMMLYHVPDQAAAAAELRRVVRPGGVVVATTASADNQPELRAIVEGTVGGGWTWMRPSTASFHLENGAEPLHTAFEHVERVDAPVRRIHIEDPGAAADYVASTGDHFGPTLPPGRSWDDVVEAVRAAVPFVVTARLGAFVCR